MGVKATLDDVEGALTLRDLPKLDLHFRIPHFRVPQLLHDIKNFLTKDRRFWFWGWRTYTIAGLFDNWLFRRVSWIYDAFFRAIQWPFRNLFKGISFSLPTLPTISLPQF